jgi:hypothetical protein
MGTVDGRLDRGQLLRCEQLGRPTARAAGQRLPGCRRTRVDPPIRATAAKRRPGRDQRMSPRAARIARARRWVPTTGVDHPNMGPDRHAGQGDGRGPGTLGDRLARDLVADHQDVAWGRGPASSLAGGGRGWPEVGQEADPGTPRPLLMPWLRQAGGPEAPGVGVLHGHGGDGRHAVDPVGQERLEVGLDPGPARGGAPVVSSAQSAGGSPHRRRAPGRRPAGRRGPARRRRLAQHPAR